MTTTYVQARDALVSYISTQLGIAYPTLKLFWENTVKVDMTTVGDRFLQVGVDFEYAQAATLDTEIDKVAGVVMFRLFAKEGKGTRETLQVFDSLNTLFRQRYYGAVKSGTPRPGRKIRSDGWVSSDLILPFEYFT